MHSQAAVYVQQRASELLERQCGFCALGLIFRNRGTGRGFAGGLCHTSSAVSCFVLPANGLAGIGVLGSCMDLGHLAHHLGQHLGRSREEVDGLDAVR